jgi:hypothetical protein
MNVAITHEVLTEAGKITPNDAFHMTLVNAGDFAVKIFRDYVLPPGGVLDIETDPTCRIITDIELTKSGSSPVQVSVFRKIVIK